MRIWVIIPAYNESLSLKEVLSQLKLRGLSVLVVDDGSTDNTAAVAAQEADSVIKNERNLGKGMSLNRGITWLLENSDFDYIITMDGDGQHSPADIDKFISEAEKGTAIVVGNRMLNPSGMPRIRVITNCFMSWFLSRIAGQNIPDTQCGYRLIKGEVLRKIIIETSKFEIESEIIIKAARLGFRIKSIPIRSIYFGTQSSKIHPFIDTLRFIKFILRLKDEKRF